MSSFDSGGVVRLYVGAGEASGDRMLAEILRELRGRIPGLELRGFGGPLCAAEGLDSLIPLSDLAVNGVGDVLRRGAFLLRARARLRRELADFRPDLVLLADYPGMNVSLARFARRRSVPVHYVGPPQLWAYKNPERRLRRLRAALDGVSLQVLFPFEAEPYAPWARRISQGHFFAAPAEEPPRGDRLLLCPGSRRGVLRRNLPLWLERLRAAGWDLSSMDVLVPEYLADDARGIIGHRVPAGASIHPRKRGHSATGGCIEVTDDPPAAFARAGAAIAFPGTITLELLLRRIPTRVWGMLDPLTLWAGRRKLRGPRVALANVLSGREIFPEWIGTARDFRRAPPDLPPPDAWPVVDGDAVAAVWQKMGSDQGIADGVTTCLEHLTPPPASHADVRRPLPSPSRTHGEGRGLGVG